MIASDHWTIGPVADRVLIIVIGLWPLYALTLSWWRHRRRR